MGGVVRAVGDDVGDGRGGGDGPVGEPCAQRRRQRPVIVAQRLGQDVLGGGGQVLGGVGEVREAKPVRFVEDSGHGEGAGGQRGKVGAVGGGVQARPGRGGRVQAAGGQELVERGVAVRGL